MLFSLQIDTGIRYYQMVDACEPQTQEAKFIALIFVYLYTSKINQVSHN